MRFKRLAPCSILIFLLFFLAGFEGSGAATIQELEAKLSELRIKDKTLREKTESFRLSVQKSKEEILGIKQEIRVLSYEIDSLEAEIERTENDVELTTLQIEKVGLEIIRTLGEIDGVKSQTGQVLKKLYQWEQVSQVELVLSGVDFADFWSQHQYLSSIQTSLNNLIYQMEVLKDELEVRKREQEKKRNELKDLQEQKQIQQSIIFDKREYQKILLVKNEAEKAAYQQNLSQAEGERRRIIEEILRVEEEVKRLKNFELYLKSGKIPPPGTKIFLWPTKSRKVTQGYGATAFARSGIAGYRYHNGIDIGGNGVASPIYAAAPGKIIGKNSIPCSNYGRLRNFGCQGGWGNWVAIRHENDLVTLYAHLAQPSSILLGSEVPTGETIGFIGSSGNTTGPHLHFSIYTEFFLVPGGYPGYNPEGTLNPLLYL